MSSGSRNLIIGSTSSPSSLFGSQPVGMNRAVIRPQAMNAPMFGITIAAIRPPSRWMFARMPLPAGSGV
ncbi:hypothetical protein ACFQY7_13860 [Actinomadura luteofluorescens]|uniref:hypothetical protein n=1 Tax=Actinomadura luteofluorescens TaxID=46163 RepID=UPI00363E1EC2